MTNIEKMVSNISYLLGLEVINWNGGKIIGSGNKRIFCNGNTGKLFYVFFENGQWGGTRLTGNGAGDTSRKGYERLWFPNSSYRVPKHMIMAVAYGLYAGIAPSMLYLYNVNHMNFRRQDNRVCNLEVVLETRNQDHKNMKAILIKLGAYVEGYGYKADWATNTMELYKNNPNMIATLYKIEVIGIRTAD